MEEPDVVLVEKCCSRCHQLNWDSDTGSYNETCNVDGKKCDNTGQVRKWGPGNVQIQ